MAAKAGKRSKLLWGCGISIAQLVALVIGAIVFYYIWSPYDTSAWMLKQLRDQYPKWAESGIIPAGHRAAFDELADAAQEPEASLGKVRACYGTLSRALDHGPLTPYEIDLAESAATYVREHPGFDLGDYHNFLVQFPEVGKEVEDLQLKWAETGFGRVPQAQPQPQPSAK